MKASGLLPKPAHLDPYAMAACEALAAAALLAVLVAAGLLDVIDGYAVHHLMPFGTPINGGANTLFERLIAYDSLRFHPGRVLRLPASALGSSTLIVAVALALARRGRREAAVLWLCAFALANVVELAGKVAIAKPTLYIHYKGTLAAVGFTHSFPSGHAARAAILVGAATYAWPRHRLLFRAWLAVVLVTAELDAIHTPSDLAGGLLLGAGLGCMVFAVERHRARSSEAQRTHPVTLPR